MAAPVKKMVVAMSGGVDSSVTAMLMKEQGYEVIGITLQLYDHGKAIDKKGACCAGKDIHDARTVADKLGIPHYVLNYEGRFREAVMDDFVDTYLKGETPIPCVRCNQRVKFRDMLDTARDLGAEYMVTGHYARIIETPQGPELKKAFDAERDQSYFLFATTREQLDFIRFPLGEMTKPQIRELARKYDLPVFAKPDSQDICFVPSGKYIGVIEKLRPGAIDPGEIVHVDGRVLGKHDGIINYTVGQRRGIGVSAPEPYYVVGVDADTRRVYVGPKEALAVEKVHLKDFNWLIEKEQIDAAGKPVEVKYRSTQAATPATIHVGKDGEVEVRFNEAQYGVSPGQALVAYQEDKVIGGGWILKEARNLQHII